MFKVNILASGTVVYGNVLASGTAVYGPIRFLLKLKFFPFLNANVVFNASLISGLLLPIYCNDLIIAESLSVNVLKGTP